MTTDLGHLLVGTQVITAADVRAAAVDHAAVRCGGLDGVVTWSD